MTFEAWYLVPLAGLLGSLHCASMCGPFAAYLTLGSQRSPEGTSSSAITFPWQAFGRHIGYQGGRLVTYVVLGAVAGWLGHSVLKLGEVLNAQRVVWVFLGLFMIGAGLLHYLPSRRMRLFAPLSKQIGKILRSIRRQVVGIPAATLVGLMSTLLPCGFLYSFATAAVAMGDPVGGIAIMAGFWLGTLPALTGVAFATSFFSAAFLRRLHALAPAMLILFGILALLGKWQGVAPVMGLESGVTPPSCHGF